MALRSPWPETGRALSISALIDGLAPGGKLVIVGAEAEPLAVSPLQIIMARRSIQGWSSGTAKDSEDTLQFSALTGVRPMIERYPLGKAADAYDQMISGRARFRVVLSVAPAPRAMAFRRRALGPT